MNVTFPTLGQLVAEKPARSRVFEKLGLDYCCGGKRSLDEVCHEKGLGVDEVLKQINACDTGLTDNLQRDWRQAGFAELCDHIETTHHRYMKEELPALTKLLQKVSSVHGQLHPEVKQVEQVFVALRGEMESHMAKEEQILFPMCRQLDEARGVLNFHCGTIRNPISVMEHEHESAGSALETIQRLTDNYRPPADVCNSYKAMLERLRMIQLDMHQHVHKENNILFPRAIAKEDALLKR